jgi:lysine 6-dehydrogenase
MRLLALGGAGAMGRKAIDTLLSEYTPDELIIADLDETAATSLASSLASRTRKVTGVPVDVSDIRALKALLADADVVMNSTGPFFRFGVPILRAAIETGTTYVDICDDPEPTVEMLRLHTDAVEAGVTALIGAGASPGFMNVMAAQAVAELDEVDDVTSAWSFDSDTQDWDLLRSFDGKSKAALVHFFQQITGTVLAASQGELVQIAPLQPRRIDIADLGSGWGYTVGHPEPVTFPDSFGIRGTSMSLCLMTAARAAEFAAYAERIEDGRLTVDDAARLLMVRDDAIRSESSTRTDSFESVGSLPIYAVVATGVKDGKEIVSFAGTRRKPEPMEIGTGVPFAAAVLDVIENDHPAGVFAPENLIVAEPFFRRVAKHWGVPRDELFFAGTTPSSPAIDTNRSK